MTLKKIFGIFGIFMRLFRISGIFFRITGTLGISLAYRIFWNFLELFLDFQILLYYQNFRISWCWFGILWIFGISLRFQGGVQLELVLFKEEGKEEKTKKI